jgi:hypothetical protein
MTEDQIKVLALCRDYFKQIDLNLDIITSASDFRLITEAPVSIDPYLESKHLQIHQDAADDGEIQSWGFADTISALLNIGGEDVEFMAFKGAGYSVKIYLTADRSSILGVVVTSRADPAPLIDASGRVYRSPES